MKVIELNARGWRTPESVWEAVLQALGAPAWHGHNLDALHDSVSGNDLNAVLAPFRVEVAGLSEAAPAARVTALRMARLLRDLRTDGAGVSWAPELGDGATTCLSAFEAFRVGAREKARLLQAGDSSRDHELHASMGGHLRTLFGGDSVGRDCIVTLATSDEPEVASWVATELAARGEPVGVEVLERLAQLPGTVGFGARVALTELRRGRLGSPFQVASA